MTEIVDAVRSRLAAPLAARLVVRVGEDVPTIRVPKSAFCQAISNLVTNAFDASDAEGEVEVVIEARGDQVAFVVVDHGAGMTEAELARAVEPFYTTKQQGRGMGLGLFLSRAVAEQLGGALTVESTKGCGTTARVEVPL